jgi:hypothetical protein
MKKLALVLSIVFAAGVAAAQEAPKPQAVPAPDKAAKVEKAKHEVSGEIVSTDEFKRTVTFRNDKGESLTWSVEGKAADNLKNLKAGEKVKIVYRANDMGEPQAATAIQKAESKPEVK